MTAESLPPNLEDERQLILSDEKKYNVLLWTFFSQEIILSALKAARIYLISGIP